MSYHPYRLQSIENERHLLEKLLTLEDKVRVARENERRLKSSQSSHYTKMFQPITNSLKQLNPSHIVKAHISTSTDDLSDNGNNDDNLDESSGSDEKDIIDGAGNLYKRGLKQHSYKCKR